MTTLAPWANGPFELILHAEEHLRKGEDFDRRIALICFDDAIEVSVTTYLTLHPSQRGNREYTREKRDQWLRNFHTKLDFLGEELTIRSLTWQIDKTHIVWAHDHRNEQYHGGARGVPQQDVLAISRNAALWIFGVLFSLADVEELVRANLTPAAPPRMSEYDDAINAAINSVTLGGSVYTASELLYHTDYDAYREIGSSLIEDTEEERVA